MRLFGRKKDEQIGEQKGEQSAQPVAPTQPQQLSGDSTVREWLAHPVGGAIFRDLLKQAGQDEKALRPVHRLSLKRLAALSRGQFSQEMIDDMARRANAGEMPAGVTVSAAALTGGAPESSAPDLPEWQEVIMPNRFTGKTVIVTGAGSGIGRATASRVAREGGRVIAVDISRERLDEFKLSLPDANITVVIGDITDDTSVSRIVEAAGDTIDALANVAGIMDNMTPLHEMSDEVWNRVMNVNVLGAMKLSRAVLPKMLAKNKGSIVNVGSEASLRGSAAGAAYTTSKHAIMGLSKNMAFMYGPSGIRTNVVAPGAVLTNIEARYDSKLGEERVNSVLATIPDAVNGDALAASITFLLSDDGVNLNGVVLPSDGGWSVQ
jgi:NAD(P)-dependent dehydrogenase (short-subunit alcohol dehydrogenase family)